MIITKNYPASKQFATIFDEFFSAVPQSYNNGNLTSATAPVNIAETADAFEVSLIAPGVAKEKFQINLEKGLLTISYDHAKTEANKDVKSIRQEFSVRSFKRTFTVDDKVNADAIEARYENGILKVVLPKKEEVKVLPKQIQIQ